MGHLANADLEMSTDHYECSHCGKTYSAPRFLEAHQRSCRKAKRKFSEILEETRLLWEAKKRQRRDTADINNAQLEPDPVVEFVEEETNIQAEVAIREDTREREVSTADLSQKKSSRKIRPNPRYGDNGWDTTAVVINDDITALASTSRLKLTDIRRLANVPSKIDPFRVRRSYMISTDQERLIHDPDSILTVKDLTDAGLRMPQDLSSTKRDQRATLLAGTPLYGPFPNKSSFEVAEWFWNSNGKSFLEFQKLMGIFKQPTFCFEDMISTNWPQTFRSLGANKDDLPEGEGAWIDDDGWKRTEITIDVPFHSKMRGSPGTKSHRVGELRHRSIMSVIKEKVSNADDFRQFHYTPYKATWRPNDALPEVELYGEMYTSRAFREAHEEVQRLPKTEANTGLERVVVGLMFSSDATSLTHFGPASLWPCYLMFANESKGRRFTSWALSTLKSPIDTEREEKQRSDAEQRRLISQARTKIYDDEYAVSGEPIGKILDDLSLNPVESPFLTLPTPKEFSLISALVVDILHEFEIGVWKRFYIHLLRLLDAAGVASALLAALDGYEDRPRNIDIDIDQYLEHAGATVGVRSLNKIGVCLEQYPLGAPRRQRYSWSIFYVKQTRPPRPRNRMYDTLKDTPFAWPIRSVFGNIVVVKSTREGTVCNVEEKDRSLIEIFIEDEVSYDQFPVINHPLRQDHVTESSRSWESY
ncbi:hypothetical protein D9611_002410 [Ephemerocybe angulata]|uniref:C2H2-type domain-containing protein n=1 Tax=Ephemerocybe angulata TaxID=980116 RepID=A0A8H5FDH4_9AGAR|nr:hypothetical protein D9611_002410 [Tulosesus angulatus]